MIMDLSPDDAIKIRSCAMAAAKDGTSLDLFRALRSATTGTRLGADQLFGILVGLGVDAIITGTVIPDPAAPGGPLAMITQSDVSTPGVDVNPCKETRPLAAV